MKLYNRDYTILTEEEKTEWEKIENENNTKSGNSKFRRAYRPPKAIRHHRSLFPNNFLDPIDLKEKAGEFEATISSFEKLIRENSTKERDILRFINDEERYFIIGSLFKNYEFGHHEAHLFKEFQLGNSYKADYLLVGKGSGGWEFVFIELEAPYVKITINNGEFGETIRKGLSQIYNWDYWIESNYNSIRETFQKALKEGDCLPKEFINLDKSRIHYILIAGRRNDFKEKTYREKRKKNKDSITVFHYDNLIESAKDIIGKNSY